MWVARLREQDASTYGHGLQVSVYLTSFGRHLGFPKEQLAMLAQIGLLLDIGKIRLPKELLEKQGKLTDEEFAIAKKHVDHSIDILAQTPNFDAQVLDAIGQHHERLNGSGYPKGLQGDEISISGPTLVGELANGEIREYEVHPSHFGLELYDRSAIQVGTVDESKARILAVLQNEPGPALNIVLLNAGAAIYVAGRAKSIQEGIERARKVIASGEAKAKLDEFIAATNQFRAKG